MSLSFQTDRSGQTVMNQIRLLLVWSGSTLVFHSVCIFWTHYSMVMPPCFNFRVITANFPCVRTFIVYRVTWLRVASLPYEPQHDKPQYGLCAQRRLRSAWVSTQSDRVFEVPSMSSQRPNIFSCRQQRLWSDWADAQADLSLRWAQKSVYWFCHEGAHMAVMITVPPTLSRCSFM